MYNIYRGSEDNDNIKVYPNYMSENTGKTDRRSRLSVDSRSSIDTRHYWKLSENIYRYKHWNYFEMEGPLGGIHTINESMSISLFFKLRWLTRSDRSISKSWKTPHSLVIKALPRQGLITGYNGL